MKIYFAIDGGTTNTRISLVCDGAIKETVKVNIGAKKSIGGNTELKHAIGDAIHGMLTKYNLLEKDVICCLASGMITSEYGLCKLDHLVAPAGIQELHNGMCKTELPEIANIPFYFIPGVKVGGASYGDTDMMRGEETEVMGVYCGQGLYVLPGSHSKFIKLDENGAITNIVSMLSGEMLYALATDTILKDSVDLSVSKTDDEYLVKGYKYCDENGVNASLFKVRVLKNLLGATKEAAYSFFMGVALHDEIEQILKSGENKIIIGGRAQIKDAMTVLLKALSDKEIVPLSEKTVDASTVNGMIRIYEYKCN